MEIQELTGNPNPLDVISKINELVKIVRGGGAVGDTYIQFAGQPAPSELYDGQWENVSSQYAGLFFRAEGGAAADFGGTQSGGAPNASGNVGAIYGPNPNGFGSKNGVFKGSASSVTNSAFVNQTSQTNKNINSQDIVFRLSDSFASYSLTEFRTDNSTLRIWKRTA